MLLKEVLKGEHFVVGGETLYRKTDDGYIVYVGENENPAEDTAIMIVNPWKWFADHMKKPDQRSVE